MLFAAASLQVQQNLLDFAKDILEAFPALPRGHKLLEWLKDKSDKDSIMMLDSGAFSAWTKGREVPIDDYIKYCLELGDLFTAYVNVDVIPGKWGQIPSNEQVEESAQKGWDNFVYMLSRGISRCKLIHVFHQGEDFKWLDRLVNFHKNSAEEDFGGRGYIGLSPANDRSTKQKIMWLEKCMPYITDENGNAIIDFHGFGVTAVKIMQRFPFHTVDSTSWMRSGTFGVVMIPDAMTGSYLKPTLISMTDITGVSQGSRHFGALAPLQKEKVKDYFATFGFTVEDVKEDSRARNVINLTFYKQIMKEINSKPIRWKPMQEGFI